ncbi:MAG: hypothetical protein QXO71_07890 [Candidatus Jordarchaeaceae archaeon]
MNLICPLDSEGKLTHLSLNIMRTLQTPESERDFKKLGWVLSTLYLLVNNVFSREIKEVEEINLDYPFTLLNLAFHQREEKTLKKAKQITVDMFEAIRAKEYYALLGLINQIDKNFDETKKLADDTKIRFNLPSTYLYPLTFPEYLTRIKSILPPIIQIIVLVLFFMTTTFSLIVI